MKKKSRLFTRWYQELQGFNFSVVHKKGEGEQQRRWTQPVNRHGVYAEFYKIDDPVIKCEGRVNKIQHVQHSTGEIVKAQG